MSRTDRKKLMGSAATITDATRSALGLLVDWEARRVGSRDVAVGDVAKMVGTSSSWVKKFLARSPEVKEPRITLYLNIRESYERLCHRVEEQHAIELLKISKLRGELNAAVTGFDTIVDLAIGAQASGTPEAARGNRLDGRMHDHGFDPPRSE